MACLVLLLDGSGRGLGLSSDGLWRFSREPQALVLRASGAGLYSLQHSASGAFLGASGPGGRLLSDALAPVTLSVYWDAERSEQRGAGRVLASSCGANLAITR